MHPHLYRTAAKQFARAILLACLAGSMLQATAQESSRKVSITWGQPFEGKRTETIAQMVGHDGDNVYVLRTKAKFMADPDYTLVRLNGRLVEDRALGLDLNSSYSDRRYLSKLLHWNDQMLLFTEARNNKTKRRSMNVQEIDLQALRLIGRPKRLADIDFSGTWRGNSGNFEVMLSLDSN